MRRQGGVIAIVLMGVTLGILIFHLHNLKFDSEDFGSTEAQWLACFHQERQVEPPTDLARVLATSYHQFQRRAEILQREITYRDLLAQNGKTPTNASLASQFTIDITEEQITSFYEQNRDSFQSIDMASARPVITKFLQQRHLSELTQSIDGSAPPAHDVDWSMPVQCLPPLPTLSTNPPQLGKGQYEVIYSFPVGCAKCRSHLDGLLALLDGVEDTIKLVVVPKHANSKMEQQFQTQAACLHSNQSDKYLPFIKGLMTSKPALDYEFRCAQTENPYQPLTLSLLSSQPMIFVNGRLFLWPMGDSSLVNRLQKIVQLPKTLEIH